MTAQEGPSVLNKNAPVCQWESRGKSVSDYGVNTGAGRLPQRVIKGICVAPHQSGEFRRRAEVAQADITTST